MSKIISIKTDVKKLNIKTSDEAIEYFGIVCTSYNRTKSIIESEENNLVLLSDQLYDLQKK